MPDAKDLAIALSEEFGIDLGGEYPDLASVAELVELRKGRDELEAFVAKALDGIEPDEHFRQLVTFGWKAIFTTNYDDAIERSFDLSSDVKQTAVPFSVTAEYVIQLAPTDVPVFHLHGRLAASAENQRLVITETDYTKYAERRRMLFDLYRAHYATATIVYVGYSHRDSNWRLIVSELRAELAPSQARPAYRVAPSTPVLNREVLASQGISTVDGYLADLVASFPSRIEPRTGTPSSVPPALLELHTQHPLALERLLGSWQYVNGVDFSVPPNTERFFRGAQPNWGLIGNGINFERDIEESLLDAVVDFMTAPSLVKAHAVLGPAGYGVSTLLMAVSAWLARRGAGPILVLRAGALIRPGDLEFAARYLGPCAFVIDNASDVSEEVRIGIQNLRALNLSAIFLLGDRLNEWRDRRPRINCTEWVIDPLSDGEVYRLLGTLEEHHELGRLAALTPELRFATVKVSNAKELLVTLREATEGRDFDAIIEDEYRGIADSVARRAYMAVSCFARARALLRADLLAKMTGVALVDFYSSVLPRLEGVLQSTEAPDGDELFSARHHTIANVVWNRGEGRVERQSIALEAVRSLNLSFASDSKAFESLTRSDELVDDFDSLEAKTAFFESALKKEPDGPYIRQHYARMLRRVGNPAAALGQIENAIRDHPTYKNLYHTKGIILRDLAREQTSDDIGRRHLANSEAAFEEALRLQPKDEYSFTSLAELYVMWAERVGPGPESATYSSKAQEVIQRGLKVVRQRDSLFVLMGKIEANAQNVPGQVAAFQMAIRENSQALIPRYFLGTVLRKSGRLEESAAILHAGLLIDPENVHLAVAYALTLEGLNRPRAESIAVLRQSYLLGKRDFRCVALLGGLYEMNGDLTAAKTVFREARLRDWSAYEKNTVVYTPNLAGFAGRIVSIHNGFVFISWPGHADVWCSRRVAGQDIAIGQSVDFTVAFDIRGTRALHLQKVASVLE